MIAYLQTFSELKQTIKDTYVLMSSIQKFPRVSDMVEPAQRRLPPFVHAYLAAGTGQGQAMARNEAAFASIPSDAPFLRGRVTPDIKLFGFGTGICRAVRRVPYRFAIPDLAGGGKNSVPCGNSEAGASLYPQYCRG